MPNQRKLGRKTDQRNAMLKNMVTSLLQNGKLETTEMRAREVKRIAEQLITIAKKEESNFDTKEIKRTFAEKDSKGQKILKSKTSKNEKSYKVVVRKEEKVMKSIDKPSRLHARRKLINSVYRIKDSNGNKVNIVNKLFDEIAPKYKETNGGYTRIYKLGARRGDGAEMALLELV